MPDTPGTQAAPTTITEFESAIMTGASPFVPRQLATRLAGCALRARELIARGDTFANAQAAVASHPRHRAALAAADQEAVWLALTGP